MFQYFRTNAPNGPWAQQTFVNDNFEILAQEAVAMLNSFPPELALNAKASMTNMSGGASTLTIFFPQS